MFNILTTIAPPCWKLIMYDMQSWKHLYNPLSTVENQGSCLVPPTPSKIINQLRNSANKALDVLRATTFPFQTFEQRLQHNYDCRPAPCHLPLRLRERVGE
jgi:hypothetical protein